MSDKNCPFFIVKSGFFTTEYECRRSHKTFTCTDPIYSTYCSNQYNYSKCPYFKPLEEKSDCYLTCACVDALGKADNCEELTILRKFRDEWLVNQPEGQAEIQQYYSIAPAIVEAIHNLSNSTEIFRRIYDTMVLPCVDAIKDNHFESAHQLYRSKSLELEQEYLK